MTVVVEFWQNHFKREQLYASWLLVTWEERSKTAPEKVIQISLLHLCSCGNFTTFSICNLLPVWNAFGDQLGCFQSSVHGDTCKRSGH